ncbi:acyl carrier protein, partial [Lactobacillus salivarius]|nr:acyl carrier protein [Ligilactobacillus salivarius]
LDVFEIMNELEDDLDIKLEADENIKTIQDVVTYVKKELDNK